MVVLDYSVQSEMGSNIGANQEKKKLTPSILEKIQENDEIKNK